MREQNEKLRFKLRTHIDENGCWIWEGCIRKSHNYKFPWVTFRKQQMNGARAVWIAHFGEVPGDLMVLHRCNNSICMNPAHLYLGTHADNMRDLSLANRANGKNGALGLQAAARIRQEAAAGVSVKSLSEQYKCTPATIYRIVHGQRYSHSFNEVVS